jgi:hypothetical protein
VFRFGGRTEKAAKLEREGQSGDRLPGRMLIETLEASRQVHT